MTWVLSPFYQAQLQVLTTKCDSVLIRLCRVSSCRHCVIFFYNHRICLIYPLLTQYIRTNKKSLHFIHDYSANDKARISLCTTITALGFSCTKKYCEICRSIFLVIFLCRKFLLAHLSVVYSFNNAHVDVVVDEVVFSLFHINNKWEFLNCIEQWVLWNERESEGVARNLKWAKSGGRHESDQSALASD